MEGSNPLRFGVPYVATRKEGRLGIFEELAFIHMPCYEAFMRRQSYCQSGDKYALDFHPVVWESTELNDWGYVFHSQAYLLIGVTQRYCVGCVSPMLIN